MGNILTRVKQASWKQWLVVGAMTLNTAVTYIANVAFGSERSNGSISDKNRVLLTPPGGAFSIWGLIFIAQWLFVAAQLLSAPQWSADRVNLFGFCAFVMCQSLWALCFPFEIMLFCFFMIFGVWWALLALSLRGMAKVEAIYYNNASTTTVINKKGDTAAAAQELANTTNNNNRSSALCCDANSDNSNSEAEGRGFAAAFWHYIIYVAPLTLELGWITAATSLNLCIVVARDNDSLAPQLGASVFAAALIGTTAWWRGIQSGDFAVCLSIVWALCWIQARDTSLPVRVGMPATNNATVVAPAVVQDGLTDAARVLAIVIGSLTIASWFARALWVWKGGQIWNEWVEVPSAEARRDALLVVKTPASSSAAAADAGVLSTPAVVVSAAEQQPGDQQQQQLAKPLNPVAI